MNRSAAYNLPDSHFALYAETTFTGKSLFLISAGSLFTMRPSRLNSKASKQMINNKEVADKIDAASEFIEAHFDRPIKISDVAYEVGLSAGHLMRLFKERMGATFIEYLTNLRIARAKKLLLTTDKKCSHIYFEVGYNGNAYFTRRFKETVGMTPLQFRISNKKAS